MNVYVLKRIKRWLMESDDKTLFKTQNPKLSLDDWYFVTVLLLNQHYLKYEKNSFLNISTLNQLFSTLVRASGYNNLYCRNSNS